jgi:hypothetical protein
MRLMALVTEAASVRRFLRRCSRPRRPGCAWGQRPPPRALSRRRPPHPGASQAPRPGLPPRTANGFEGDSIAVLLGDRVRAGPRRHLASRVGRWAEDDPSQSARISCATRRSWRLVLASSRRRASLSAGSPGPAPPAGLRAHLSAAPAAAIARSAHREGFPASTALSLVALHAPSGAKAPSFSGPPATERRFSSVSVTREYAPCEPAEGTDRPTPSPPPFRAPHPRPGTYPGASFRLWSTWAPVIVVKAGPFGTGGYILRACGGRIRSRATDPRSLASSWRSS